MLRCTRVALRCKWMEGRSRSGIPQEVRPVVPVTTSSPRLSSRARVESLPGAGAPTDPLSPKEVVSGADHTGVAHRATPGRMWMWMYLCLERVACHGCNVGSGGGCRWKCEPPNYKLELNSYLFISSLMIRKMMAAVSSFHTAFTRTAHQTQ